MAAPLPARSRWRQTPAPGGALASWRSRNDRWWLVLTRPNTTTTVVDALDTHTGSEYTLISSEDGLERFDVGVPMFVAEGMLRASAYPAPEAPPS